MACVVCVRMCVCVCVCDGEVGGGEQRAPLTLPVLSTSSAEQGPHKPVPSQGADKEAGREDRHGGLQVSPAPLPRSLWAAPPAPGRPPGLSKAPWLQGPRRGDRVTRSRGLGSEVVRGAARAWRAPQRPEEGASLQGWGQRCPGKLQVIQLCWSIGSQAAEDSG